MRVYALSVVVLLSVLVLGCGEGGEGDEPGECTDTVDNDADGTVDCEDAGCASDPACVDGADDDDSSGPCSDIEPGPGSVEGLVVRSVPVTEDGVGTLVVSVFDADPFIVPEACEVATMTYKGVDLSAEGSSSAFSVGGIQPKETPYFATALFDDNGDFTGDEGPGLGDLVAMDLAQEMLPTVVVSDKTPVVIELDLNFVFSGAGDDDDSAGGDDDDSGADDDDSAGGDDDDSAAR
jgi:hypothetical protein